MADKAARKDGNRAPRNSPKARSSKEAPMRSAPFPPRLIRCMNLMIYVKRLTQSSSNGTNNPCFCSVFFGGASHWVCGSLLFPVSFLAKLAQISVPRHHGCRCRSWQKRPGVKAMVHPVTSWLELLVESVLQFFIEHGKSKSIIVLKHGLRKNEKKIRKHLKSKVHENHNHTWLKWCDVKAEKKHFLQWTKTTKQISLSSLHPSHFLTLSGSSLFDGKQWAPFYQFHTFFGLSCQQKINKELAPGTGSAALNGKRWHPHVGKRLGRWL